jgi:glycosyltransferase involved in cell wall biosynthesis
VILCVLSNLLGNRTFSTALADAVAAAEVGEHALLSLDGAAYRRHPAPPLVRRVAPLEAVSVARALVAEWRAGNGGRDVQAIAATSWEAFVAARAVFPGVPAVVALDGTPHNALEMPPVTPERLPRRAVKRLVERALSARLRREMRRGPVRFLAQSGWVTRSLLGQYGAAAEQVETVYTPIDVGWWSPGATAPTGTPDLLFVGNDFARKGGEILLAAYTRYLHPECTLTIVSTDPSLPGRALPDGVTLVPGTSGEPLRDLYRRAACFVLPTRRDHSPWVLAEAQAVGLPVVTADVGGVADLVVPGETAVVLRLDSPPEDWARAVRSIITDPGRQAAMSTAARRHALATFDTARFRTRVGEILSELLDGPPRPA